MLASYTAAALVSENRALCFPASSDSIPTSAGQEDHVSMGMTAARKAARIAVNSELAVAVEALAASQGLSLRAPLSPAPATAAALASVREVSPELDEDRPLSDDIESTRQLIENGAFLDAVKAAAVELS
jgi:histidine ammonia-lyase